jgi:hypothetical protein
MKPISQSTENDPEYLKECEALANAVGAIIQAHLKKGPNSRRKVYQALNALGLHAGVILAGCDDDEAVNFFQDCVEVSYDEFAARAKAIAVAFKRGPGQ